MISSMLILNFLFQAMRYIVGKGLSVETILQYVLYNLAWILVLVVPMAALVASIMAFGRLASDNEITAIKANGISYYRLIIPVIFVGALVTYGLIEFNNRVLPFANHKARILKSDIKNKRPTLIIQPGVYLDEIENFSMIVEEKNDFGREIFGVTIFDKSTRDITRSITARKGEITIDPKSENLILSLEDGEIHDVNLRELSKYQKIQFEKHVVKLNVPNLVMKESDSKYYTDREKSTGEMTEEVERYKTEIDKRLKKIEAIVKKRPDAVEEVTEKYKDELLRMLRFLKLDMANLAAADTTDSAVVDSAFGEDAKDSSDVELAAAGILALSQQKKKARRTASKRRSMTAEEKHNLERRRLAQQLNSNVSIITSYRRTIDKLLVEIYKKYSIPAATIFFVLIGAALGIKVRKGGIGVAGGISLMFFILYYICLVTGEDLADRQILDPFWAMWSPNIVLGFFGVYLTHQTASERRFFFFDIPEGMRTLRAHISSAKPPSQ